MNNDLSSYFEDPEFKEALEKYEGMVKNHTPAYFDADELTDIAEYYASKGRQIEAEAAIDFALQLHPNDTDALIFRARSLAMKGRLDEAYMVMDLIEDRSDREVRFLKADLLMEEKRMAQLDPRLDGRSRPCIRRTSCLRRRKTGNPYRYYPRLYRCQSGSFGKEMDQARGRNIRSCLPFPKKPEVQRPIV